MATKKRTGLGRGIGALIPTNDAVDEQGRPGARPVDVFFAERGETPSIAPAASDLVEVPGARLAYLDPADIARCVRYVEPDVG